MDGLQRKILSIINGLFWWGTIILGNLHIYSTSNNIHRIGWWENLQESPIFDGKNHGFL